MGWWCGSCRSLGRCRDSSCSIWTGCWRGVSGLGAAARAPGVAPEEVVAAVAALGFAERVVVADEATRVQAPEASQQAEVGE
jgi:hypothetical protein